MKHQQLNLLFIINSSAVSIISYTKTIHETFSDLKKLPKLKSFNYLNTRKHFTGYSFKNDISVYIFFHPEIRGTNLRFHLHCNADLPATTIRSGTCMVTVAFGNPSWLLLSRSAFWGATLSFSGTLMRWLMPSVYSISYCSRFISAISAAGDGNAAPLILPRQHNTQGQAPSTRRDSRCFAQLTRKWEIRTEESDSKGQTAHWSSEEVYSQSAGSRRQWKKNKVIL